MDLSAEPDSLLLHVHAAGLELHALLAVLDGDPVAARVHRAIQELDQTVRDLQVVALDRLGDLVADGTG